MEFLVVQNIHAFLFLCLHLMLTDNYEHFFEVRTVRRRNLHWLKNLYQLWKLQQENFQKTEVFLHILWFVLYFLNQFFEIHLQEEHKLHFHLHQLHNSEILILLHLIWQAFALNLHLKLIYFFSLSHQTAQRFFCNKLPLYRQVYLFYWIFQKISIVNNQVLNSFF